MEFLIVLVATTAACFVCRNAVKRCPLAFYVGAFAVDALFIVGLSGVLPRALWMVLLMLVQKCYVALALFAVVMYIGVFSRSSKVSLWLRPIRGELSIIAWILSLGHVSVYLAGYAPLIASGAAVSTNVLVSIMVALVLLVLLMLLGVTSFRFVKRRMSTDGWIRLQKLAYPFFALVYVHLLMMLAPAAVSGGIAATESLVVYTVVFGAWAVARTVRFAGDRKAA